jgi:hypothetical protein
LTDTAPDVPLAVFVPEDTPWWVVARAVHDNSFPLRGEFVKVSVTHDPQEARMVFHTDCSLSIKVRVATKQSLKA